MKTTLNILLKCYFLAIFHHHHELLCMHFEMYLLKKHIAGLEAERIKSYFKWQIFKI